MYNPFGTKRKAADNIGQLSEKEMIYGFKTIAFNSGTYQLTNDTLITHSLIAKVQGFEGGKQHFKFNNTEKETSLVMYDETYPNETKPPWSGKLKIIYFLKPTQ